MTRSDKWKLALPTVGVITLAFACGAFVGSYKDAAAMYINRPEYNQHVADYQIRMLRDSLTRAAQYSDEVKRLERIERIVYKMACHDFPTECDD